MNSPKTIIIAALAGVLPALIWLWFWLKEDRERPEPKGLILLTFVLGMISVLLVLPLEKFASIMIMDKTGLTVALGFLEEFIKYIAASGIALKSRYADEPIDYPIYMITAALGFAAFENILFLIQPISIQETAVSLLTGNLRFLGATLLHTASSAIIGIGLGLAFYKGKFTKTIYFLVGLITAVALHSIFNFYIMKSNGENFLQVFAFLWVFTVMILLIMEKIRRMSPSIMKQISIEETAQTH
ncbi:MAG: hypothetical protein US50_C0022G0004 [Candidatus Nomurabacteria bacterium GW2011_GWB1_37_5]|uniref:Protease PrsW n=1 Tax=Candidatus Nomurabacteria bacterium GW2011_GWB1_37_5 TaxID=1618742 RepID=A0A0G0K3J5_9BACT|nr:MAG: hypothetical protein US50_C0022G0004 [Candidatus Nomurabacteria bacterium GW2011_GWB1_37_5]